MNELIQAWTRAGNAVAAYFEKAAQVPSTLIPPGTVLDTTPGPIEAPKPRKPRAPKAEAPAAPVAPAAPAPAPTAGEVTEEASLLEIKAIAKTYVQRFANQVDGIKAFRQLMSDKVKVARLDDLVHAQRLIVIEAAKAEIAKATPAVAAANVGAGTEV